MRRPPRPKRTNPTYVYIERRECIAPAPARRPSRAAQLRAEEELEDVEEEGSVLEGIFVLVGIVLAVILTLRT